MVRLIEGFQDADAGATHVKQPYVKKFFDTAPDLVATQPQILYIDARMAASARWATSASLTGEAAAPGWRKQFGPRLTLRSAPWHPSTTYSRSRTPWPAGA